MLGVQCCAIVAIVHATVHVYDSFERTYNEKTKSIGPIFIYVNQVKVTQFMHKSGVEKFVPLMHKPRNSTHKHFQKLGKYMWGKVKNFPGNQIRDPRSNTELTCNCVSRNHIYWVTKVLGLQTGP